MRIAFKRNGLAETPNTTRVNLSMNRALLADTCHQPRGNEVPRNHFRSLKLAKGLFEVCCQGKLENLERYKLVRESLSRMAGTSMEGATQLSLESYYIELLHRPKQTVRQYQMALSKLTQQKVSCQVYANIVSYKMNSSHPLAQPTIMGSVAI